MAFFIFQNFQEAFMSENKDDGLDLLSVEEAAAYLKFSTNYIYRLAKENKIPHVNFGRRIIFRKRDLYGWIGSMVKGA